MVGNIPVTLIGFLSNFFVFMPFKVCLNLRRLFESYNAHYSSILFFAIYLKLIIGFSLYYFCIRKFN